MDDATLERPASAPPRAAASAPTPPIASPFDGASTLLRAIAAGELSAVQALDFTIARIERVDPLLNAVVVRDFERARDAADAADRRLARGERAPLLGLPMTVKESFHVRGLPTSWGVPELRGRVARSDSLVVQRLRQAGAVIVGKTNVSAALSDWQCDNPVHGRTRNPWNGAHTPGGSSGGSATALAAGMSWLEIGSDVAGSIRVPAHHCGVYGHRSSAGLVSAQGCTMPSTRCPSDLGAIGPMARRVDDLELALRVLAGPGLPEAAAWRVALPAPRRERLKDFKVLLLDRHPLVRTGDAVRAALQRLAERLAQCGVQVAAHCELLPDLTRTAGCFTRTLVMQSMARLPLAHFEAEVAAGRAAAMTAATTAETAETAERAADRAAERAAESAAESGPASGGAALFELGRSAACGGVREWFDAVEERAALTRQWRRCLDRWDVIVCPTSTTPAPLHDTGPAASRRLDVDGDARSSFDQLAWISMASLAGLPATQVPLGIDACGLPVGAQVMAAPYDDLTAIAFARHLERQFGGFVPPPAATA